MKRVGNLYSQIISLESLVLAEGKARRGKRDRTDVSAFRLNLESGLINLHDDLENGRFKCGAFTVFNVRDPKARRIAAPPYRDRILHHALCAVIEPIFDRGFIFDSYSCRKGKGTHAAIERVGQFLAPTDFVFHGDIQQFFPSIDHAVTKALVRKRIKCTETLRLLDQIIDSGQGIHRGLACGLPIGSLTSQLLANVVLDGLDRFVKLELGVERYIRYCDDFLIFDPDKRNLSDLRASIERHVESEVKLTLHPTKRQITPARAGISFLGFRHGPHGRRRLLPQNGRRFCARLVCMIRDVEADNMTAEAASIKILSWQAHANYGHTQALQRSIFIGASAKWVSDKAPGVARGLLEQQQFRQLPLRLSE